MTFYIGVIYPDDKGNKWIVLDRYRETLLVSRIDARDDINLAVDLDGFHADIRRKNGGILTSNHVTGGIL